MTTATWSQFAFEVCASAVAAATIATYMAKACVHLGDELLWLSYFEFSLSVQNIELESLLLTTVKLPTISWEGCKLQSECQ